VIRKQVDTSSDSTARRILNRIDEERMIHEVEKSLAAASADHDAKAKAKHRLADLKIALDRAEDTVEWPALVAEAEGLIPSVRNVVREHGQSGDQKMFESLEAEVLKAIQLQNADILRKRIEALRGFTQMVLDRKGIMQMHWFDRLCEMKADMRDQATAEQLISQGKRAISNNDIDSLRGVNSQLIALLPTPPPPPDISTIS